MGSSVLASKPEPDSDTPISSEKPPKEQPLFTRCDTCGRLTDAIDLVSLCIAYCYALCMAQLVTRIENALAESMDELIAQGAASSRSELVRMGLERLIDERRRLAIGLQIVDAYTETPQTDLENSELDAATRALILEEPW